MTSFNLNQLRQETSLQHVEYHETLDSTSKLAAELLSDLLPLSPAIVLAATQTAGRGRGSNAWWANEGALTFSLVLNPADLNLPLEKLPMISLAVGVAVRTVVASQVPESVVAIKWPNDVLLNDSKVCGILTEQISVSGRAGLIIGVGLNVNNSLHSAPDDVVRKATSLFDVTGESLNLTDLLVALLNAINASISDLANDSRSLLADLNTHSLLNNRAITIRSGEESWSGECLGINEDGALVLRTKVGVREFIAGTILSW